MPLNRQTVIDDIRASDPELFEDWSDEGIFAFAKQEIPDLRDFDVSPGKSAYEAFGASEAPGFVERMGMQFETQFQETKTGLYGLMPWTETDAYENQRIYNQRLYEEKIANNQSLQALAAWKEDEPGWTNLHTAQRSLSEALPSLAISIVATLPAVLLAKPTGGASLSLAAKAGLFSASLAPMFAIEAGGQYNEAMATLADIGLDPEEARTYAAITSVGYGAVSSIFEKLGAKHYLKIFGIGKEQGEKLLRKSIAQRIVDSKINSNLIVRAGIRGSAGIAKTLEGALMEGSTETIQAYIQNTINRGLELNLGTDQLSVQEAAKKAFKETWNNPQVWEEGFAGATTGVLGLPFGTLTKTQASKADVEQIVRDKRKRQELTSDEKITSKPVSDAVTKYFNAVLNTEDTGALQDFMDEIEADNSSTSQAIKKVENTVSESVSVGQKLLRVISEGSQKESLEKIKQIENAENSDSIINFIFDEISNTQKGAFKGKLNKKQKLAIIKNFATKGKIKETKIPSETGELSEFAYQFDPNASTDLSKIVKTNPSKLKTFDKGKPIGEDTGKIDRGKPVGGVAQDIDPNKLASPGEQDAKKKYQEEVGKKADKSKVGKVFTLPENLKSQNKGLNKFAGKKVKVSKITQNQKYELKDIETNIVTSVTPGELDSLGIDQEVKDTKTTKEQVNESSDLSQIEKDLESGSKGNSRYDKTQYKNFKSDPIKYLKSEIKSWEGIIKEGETKSILKGAKEKLKQHQNALREAIIENDKAKSIIDDEVIETKDSSQVDTSKGSLAEIEKSLKEEASISKLSIEKDLKKTSTYKNTFKEQAEKDYNRNQENYKDFKNNPIEYLQNKIGSYKRILKEWKKEFGKDDPLVKNVEKDIKLQESALKQAMKTSSKKKPSKTKEKITKIAPKEFTDDLTPPQVEQDDNVKIAPDQLTSDLTPPGTEKEISIEEESNNIKFKNENIAKNAGFSKWNEVTESLGIASTSENFNKLSENQIKEAAKKEGLESREMPSGLITSDEKQETSTDATKKALDTFEKRQTKKNESETSEDDKFFQEKDSSILPYLKDEPEFVERLINRLKKHFPNIETSTFEGLIEEEGIQAIGAALEGMVMWSTTDGRLDTIPHEYAHIYVKMFKNDPLIKKGIKLFEDGKGNGEENLVLAIGKYYVNRMKNEPRSLKLKLQKWLKQFVARMKRMFGFNPKSKQEVMEFIAEEMYQGRWLGVALDPSNSSGINYMSNEVETDEDGESDEDSKNEETGGNLNKTNAMSSDDAYHSFYHKVFGITLHKEKDYPYIKKLELEKETKDFDIYLDKLYERLNKIVSNRNWESDNLKKREDLTPDELMILRREWTKGAQLIKRFDSKSKIIGKATRLYFRIISNFNLKKNTKKEPELRMEVADELDRVNNSLFPSNVTANSVERDYINGDINIRLGFLPIKQIMSRITTRTSQWFVSSNKKIDLESLKEIQAINEQRYNSKLEKEILKIQKSIKETDSLEDIVSKLKEIIVQTITINGTKFGDNSSIISTLIQENNPHEITPDKFKELIDKELEIGNINQEHYDLMMKQSYYNVLSKLNNDFVSFSLSDYIDTWVKENPNGEINDLFEILTEKDKKGNTLSVKYTSYKHSLSNQLQQLRFWQSIRTPDYFRYEKSAADSMIRLSIDLAEGARPRNLRDLKLMIIPTNWKVSARIPKRDSSGNIVTDENDKIVFIQSKPIPYDLFDGGSINGTQWLKELGENIGYKPFQQIKTFIRDRSINKDGSVDYLGMKHMQFAGFKDMVIEDENGNTVAKMVQDKNTKLTNWVAINPDGTDGQKFDQISSSNEAKMTYGKYASLNQKKKAYPNDKTKHQEGYGVVHSIKSSSIVINQVQEKSKIEASFPIPLGELMLGVPVGKETKAVLSRIRARYMESVKHYADTINRFYTEPGFLYNFVKKSREDGEIISELEEYIELIGADGYGLQHPAIMTHLIPSINNKIIKNGLNKGRSTNKTASTLYIKPSFNGVTQETNNQHVKKDHVILSSGNKVAFDYVLKKFKEFSSENKKIVEDTNIKNSKARHTLINTYLNPFLEANEINVLLHRNPISKVTNPVVRRVQSIEEGHGESMLLTNDDVKKIFDGDWDGDKGVFEFVGQGFANDMKAWEQYSKDKNLSRIVSLPIFGARIDSGKSKEKSTALSSADHSFDEENSSDTLKEISRNALNSGTTGIAMNGRTILNQLFSKDLKILTKIKTAGELKNGIISVANLNSKVVLDYIPIDKDMMTRDEIKTLEENGDSLVGDDGSNIALDKQTIENFEGDIYLKTTKSHEMAILFQMAVDGSKFTHLADILQNSDQETFMDFMITRMFQKKLADGKSLKSKFTEKEIALLKQVYDAQNYSKQRGGRTRTGLSATMDVNISFSRDLNNIINGTDENDQSLRISDKKLLKDSPKGLLDDTLYSQNFKRKMSSRISDLGKSYKGVAAKDFDISLKNNITPMEALLIGLDNNLEHDYIDSFKNPTLSDMAHISAMNDVWNSSSIQNYIEKMEQNPEMKEVYDNAEAFLHQKIPYIETGKGKLSEILTDGKDTKVSKYSFIDIWSKLMEQTADKEQIQSDKNLMFAEFKDKFLPKYETLTKDEKKWVTLRFLSGNLHNNEIYIDKLLPKIFLDNSIMKTYLKSWETKLRDEFIAKEITPKEVSPKKQRKIQRKKGFLKQKKRVVEVMESYGNRDEINNKVCK